MFFREAKIEDIEKMHQVRTSVQENKLVHPGQITPDDYKEMLTKRGKGWVCEVEDDILGFAIVDLQKAHVWALFVRPAEEGNFIGRMLHDMMTTWCFARDIPKLWLTTSPGTRAEKFYVKAGWRQTGMEPNGEIRFELENNLELY
ncbi:GNAT family N-acetyltransferase [Adhaeribacter aquaticus]|uniref:GNAT family N-acetyltransferase n=1 Tax=Adhaeribacter aquaticus TaxID=299567 RepID=UPI0004254D1C|nr:GNAT family N-acetyltransferase [Adhaeribacter aquaticus]